MSETTNANWLTQEAFDRLSAELEELRGPKRADISPRIEHRNMPGPSGSGAGIERRGEPPCEQCCRHQRPVDAKRC